MPASKPATLRAEDLPDIMKPIEVAAFERSDVRIIRRALERGEVPGAYKRGHHWKIAKAAYLAGIGGCDVDHQ